jgi:hypothetical protein
MRRPIAILAIVVVATLAGAGSAGAAIQGVPQFSFSEFTKAQVGAGNTVTATFIWLPPTFLGATANDKQVVLVAEVLGTSTAFSAGPTASSFPLLLSDGHQYDIAVGACQTPTCVFGSVNTADASGTTRIDATPPTGTVSINGGAVATNNRTVTLALAATDPLIGGAPGTSSGVTQEATDVDGNGTFPCEVTVIDGDNSGCARPFVPSVAATVPAGDGVKTVGVKFGDGARANTRPCPTIICAFLLGAPILGNESPVATDTILLDTVKPVAIAVQDRFSVERGGSVAFDAGTSLDTSPVTPSGIDPAATSWDFKDGTPAVTGAKVTHAYSSVGTFVGELRVRDRAGNVSDARAFSVTVDPKPGDTIAGGGSIAGVTGTAGFSISRLRVSAKYARSRLKGTVRFEGTSTLAGGLRAELRRTAGGKLLRGFSSTLAAAPFAQALTLPANLLPGTYRLSFTGPGGTLSTTLTLTAPREGVVRTGRVTTSAAGAVARFAFAARPVKALRAKLTVRWSQGGRGLGVVPVGSGAKVTAPLPPGAALRAGALRAELRAGTIVVGSAVARVR